MGDILQRQVAKYGDDSGTVLLLNLFIYLDSIFL